MKIFIDTRSLDAKIISGIPEYTRFLVKNLTEMYPEEKYLFFSNGFHRKRNPSSAENLPGKTINYGIPNKIWDTTNRFSHLPNIDKLVKADVYLSPHIDILSFKEPRKHILTIHDLSFIFHKEFFTWRKNFWHWRQNYQKQIKEAGCVIAVSDFTRQNILDHFRIAEGKVVRIYPGINPYYKQLGAKDDGLTTFRKQKKISYPFILHVGTLEPRKNAIGAIRSFNILKEKKEFRDLRFILVGTRGWLYEKIVAEIAASPFEKDILLWGRATEEELRYLYNLAAAFVYPSFFEGFAFPCLEAQACGTPVIASDRGPLPETLGESAFFVNPWKVYEIGMAMESILSHNNKRDELVKAGFENVKKFNWTVAAREVMETLKKNHHAPKDCS